MPTKLSVEKKVVVRLLLIKLYPKQMIVSSVTTSRRK